MMPGGLMSALAIRQKAQELGILNDYPEPIPVDDYAQVKDVATADTPAQVQSALDTQVGGGHYKDQAIQPVEYIHANKLGFCEGNVVKYITRWKQKNGLQDLLKVKHYVDLLIELEGLNPDQNSKKS